MSRANVALLIISVLGCGILTAAVRWYALSHQVLDIPVERSSHQHPTPRGGGLAIALVMLGALMYGASTGRIEWRLVEALVIGGALVAAVGWLDDHGGVRARYRILIHFAAAALALWRLGGYPDIGVGVARLHVGIFGSVLATLGIAWCVNFYNFMDGIDGIAGVEALTVGGCGAALLGWVGLPGLSLVSAIVAAAAIGFLIWNWPPARIFMGDVGSGLLGFTFAVLAVASENAGGPPVTVWGMLLGVFVFDSTVTLVRRLRRGEAAYQAHRHHAYQRALLSGHSHRAVTLGVLGLNLVLCALATVAVLRPTLLLPALAAALLLMVACYRMVERWLPMGWADEPASKADVA